MSFMARTYFQTLHFRLVAGSKKQCEMDGLLKNSALDAPRSLALNAAAGDGRA
jgi:hypothetical protein